MPASSFNGTAPSIRGETECQSSFSAFYYLESLQAKAALRPHHERSHLALGVITRRLDARCVHKRPYRSKCASVSEHDLETSRISSATARLAHAHIALLHRGHGFSEPLATTPRYSVTHRRQPSRNSTTCRPGGRRSQFRFTRTTCSRPELTRIRFFSLFPVAGLRKSKT